jgi:hypothetical protein
MSESTKHWMDEYICNICGTVMECTRSKYRLDDYKKQDGVDPKEQCPDFEPYGKVGDKPCPKKKN